MRSDIEPHFSQREMGFFFCVDTDQILHSEGSTYSGNMTHSCGLKIVILAFFNKGKSIDRLCLFDVSGDGC
jgi:hypothetical protein